MHNLPKIAALTAAICIIVALAACGGSGGGDNISAADRAPAIAPQLAGGIVEASKAQVRSVSWDDADLLLSLSVTNVNHAKGLIQDIRFCIKHDPQQDSPLTDAEALSYLDPLAGTPPAGIDVFSVLFTGSPQVVERDNFKGSPFNRNERYWIAALFADHKGRVSPVSDPLRFKVLANFPLTEYPVIGINKDFAGRVFSATGIPLANAVVLYVHNDQPLEGDLSDAQGYYGFTAIVPNPTGVSRLRRISRGEVAGPTAFQLTAQHSLYPDQVPVQYLEQEYIDYEVDLSFQTPNLPPSAALTADPLSGPAPLAVYFDASGSSDSDGTIVQYDWDWDGDGSWDLADGGATPSHVYGAEGVYNAIVQVRDNRGGTDTASVTVTVQGLQVEWVHTLGSAAFDGAAACAVDADGNSYVIGRTIAADGSCDVLLAKYSLGGTLLWQKTWGNPVSNDYGADIEIDPQGNILIAGYSNSNQVATFGGHDVFVIKIDGGPDDDGDGLTDAGGDILWTKICGTAGEETMDVPGMALDGSGNVHLMYRSFIGGGGAAPHPETRIEVLKLFSNGGLAWMSYWSYGTGSALQIGNIVASPSGQYVYVLGQTNGGTGVNNPFILKLSAASGSRAWDRLFTIPGGEFANNFGLEVDADDNVYISGLAATAALGNTGYIAKIGSAGDVLLNGRFWDGGPHSDVITSLKFDEAGNLFAAGQTEGPVPDKLALMQFDNSLNLIAAERFMGNALTGIQGPEIGLYSGTGSNIPAGYNLPVLATSGSDNSGSWINGAGAFPALSTHDIETTASVFAGAFQNFSTSTLELADGSHVQDSGGGGSDAWVARRELGNFAP